MVPDRTEELGFGEPAHQCGRIRFRPMSVTCTEVSQGMLPKLRFSLMSWLEAESSNTRKMKKKRQGYVCLSRLGLTINVLINVGPTLCSPLIDNALQLARCQTNVESGFMFIVGLFQMMFCL